MYLKKLVHQLQYLWALKFIIEQIIRHVSVSSNDNLGFGQLFIIFIELNEVRIFDLERRSAVAAEY